MRHEILAAGPPPLDSITNLSTQLCDPNVVLPPTPFVNFSHSPKDSKDGPEVRYQPIFCDPPSDPDLVPPDLVTPRFSDRINFPQFRKLTIFDPD
eukprot:sb/3479239/